MSKRISVHDCQRIVIKVGSSLLVENSGINQAWLATLASDIRTLISGGTQILLVSSGAIALGHRLLNLPNRPLQLDENQAAAAVGQIELGKAWSEALCSYSLVPAQILLTVNDTEGWSGRRSYLNTRNTIERLLSLRSVPVINENDTVATSKIRYGDNDRLAARIATMISADLLILLSDIDGLYTEPPTNNPDARLIEIINDITPEIVRMAGSAKSDLSRGGMVTKIEAAKIATRAGISMIISSGKRRFPIRSIDEGQPATWFLTNQSTSRTSARKIWISGQLETKGGLTVDQGAVRALENGKSLLPTGVIDIEGSFSRGDIIAIYASNGVRIAQGLAGYDSRSAKLIMGYKSEELSQILGLGYEGRNEIVHRDNLVLTLST
ncbi:glutamate 5-kinase [Candidatus Endowatersipora endosymbiont of Watersipora subatra]|uniref:glutamate 5-kinase n=1 Tax=Candidatus Endowatersipora endosymbiont of Watersipora subatra TaxID=3077946 RepID=UPI00312C8141